MGKPKRFNSYDRRNQESRNINENYGNNRQNQSGITSSLSSVPRGKVLSNNQTNRLSTDFGGIIAGPIAFTQDTAKINSIGELDISVDSTITAKQTRGFIYVVPWTGTTDTINVVYGKKYNGQILILSGLTGNTITITHGHGAAGQVLCPGDTDYTLSDDDSVILVHDTINAIQPTWRLITGSGTGGATSLNNLSDVTITAATNNDILKYNGSAWVNSSTGVFTTLSATSSFSSTGSTTLGDNTADPINFVGRVNTDFVPKTDNAHDLGSATREWKDLYIDGTANIDNLQAGIGAFTTSLSSTGTTTLGDTGADAINIVGNVDTDIHMDAGKVIKSYDSQECGFQVTNDSITTGTEGTIQLPWLGTSSTTKAAADTDFGNATACCGINEIGGTPTFLVRKSDGSWWGVALSSFFP